MVPFVFGPLPNDLGELQFTDPLTRLCLGDHALFFTTGQHPLAVLDEQFLEALEICAPGGPPAEVNAPAPAPAESPDLPKVLFVRPGRFGRPGAAPVDLTDPAAWSCCFRDLGRIK